MVTFPLISHFLTRLRSGLSCSITCAAAQTRIDYLDSVIYKSIAQA